MQRSVLMPTKTASSLQYASTSQVFKTWDPTSVFLPNQKRETDRSIFTNI